MHSILATPLPLNKLNSVYLQQCLACKTSNGVFKGGGSNPPKKFSDFFLKSKGNEITEKEGMLGGGVTS